MTDVEKLVQDLMKPAPVRLRLQVFIEPTEDQINLAHTMWSNTSKENILRRYPTIVDLSVIIYRRLIRPHLEPNDQGMHRRLDREDPLSEDLKGPYATFQRLCPPGTVIEIYSRMRRSCEEDNVKTLMRICSYEESTVVTEDFLPDRQRNKDGSPRKVRHRASYLLFNFVRILGYSE